MSRLRLPLVICVCCLCWAALGATIGALFRHAFGGLILGLLFGIGYVVFGSWAAEKFPLDVWDANLLENVHAPKLYEMIQALSERVGMETPILYYITRPEPNAYTIERREGDPVIVVTNGLTRHLDKDEVQAVMALMVARLATGAMPTWTVASTLAGLPLEIGLGLRRRGLEGPGNAVLTAFAYPAAALAWLGWDAKVVTASDHHAAHLTETPGGILSSRLLGQPMAGKTDFGFVQISDSHIGFSKAANHDVTATLQEVIAKINLLPTPPDFILHTGDLTQLSKPEQFDTVDQVLKSAKTKTGQVFYVPGEHDVLNDGGQQYLARYGKGTHGGGWQSFTHQGVHFIGLVNVLELKAGGLGSLGSAQLAWLKEDVAALPSSTPIVVFAHVPLWSVYPPWGWGTEDSAQALGLLKRFGSVTVLNGHIHQTLQKIEGNIRFHTAMSTAFPQPAPGAAPSPGPLAVPPGELRHFLGSTNVAFVQGRSALALVDAPLEPKSANVAQITIDNFHQ